MSGLPGRRLRTAPKDQGRAWVTLAVSFFAQTITGGIYFTGGILNMYLLEAFGESKSFTSVPVAVMTGLNQMCGLLASMSVNRFGNQRTMFAGALLAATGLLAAGFAPNVASLIPTYGVMCGVGVALAYLPTMTVLSQYFDKYRVTAFAVTSSGSSFGMLVFPFILNLVVEEYSWRGTLTIISGLTLQLCVCAVLYREIPADSEEYEVNDNQEVLPNQLGSQLSLANVPKPAKKKGQKKIFHFDLLKHVPLICILISTFLRGASFSIVYVHLIAFMCLQGMPPADANQLFILLGVGSTIIRPSIGFVAHALPGNTLMFTASSSAVCGVLMLLIPVLSTSVPGIYSVVFFLGFYGGIFDSMWGPVYDSAVGTERLSSALGIAGFIYGISVFIGPTLAGYIFDVTQTYDINFYLAGVLSILACFTLLMSKVFKGDLEETGDEEKGTTKNTDGGSPLRKALLKKQFADSNGHLSNGNIGNTHLSNGHLSNGDLSIHHSNGYLSNGNLSSIHVSNGNLSHNYVSNGNLYCTHIGNGYLSKSHISNGNVSNCLSSNGNLSTDHGSNGNLSNYQRSNGNLSNIHMSNGNLGNQCITSSPPSNGKLSNHNLTDSKLNGSYDNSSPKAGISPVSVVIEQYCDTKVSTTGVDKT